MTNTMHYDKYSSERQVQPRMTSSAQKDKLSPKRQIQPRTTYSAHFFYYWGTSVFKSRQRKRLLFFNGNESLIVPRKKHILAVLTVVQFLLAGFVKTLLNKVEQGKLRSFFRKKEFFFF